MKIKSLLFLGITCICVLFFSNQLSAQQYYKVVKGNDNPATAEKVDDDVKSIDDILVKYNVSTSKTTFSKENYNFWVEFISNNKLPKKRKDIIYDLLSQMKAGLKQ